MAIRYVPYYPDPIEGQAILDNFKRMLKYKGAGDVKKRLERGMPLYELKKVEIVGENPNGNMVIRGECVSACAYLKEQGIEVDLVYIDPPFASGADYAKKVYIRRNPHLAAAIARAEQELNIEDLKAFEEKMYGDVWDKEKYLNWMYENLMAIKSIMSETASIYVHLDWHIGHYVKILLDEIFGEDRFINEIIWHYADYMQGNATNALPKKHDVIYFFTKSDNYYYKRVKVKLDAPVKRNKVVWNKETQTLEVARDENGKIIYEDFSEKYLDTVWDIGQTAVTRKTSNEYLGYSTQKPEELLRRIIEASSQKNMLVADFFGGSGVTAAVANKLGRRFIHCDVGINSIQVTRDRLVAGKAEFDVYEIKDGVSLYRNPVQTMDNLKKLIPGLKNEDSLDSFWEGAVSDSKLGLVPVYVPNLMDSTSKLLDKAMMFHIMHEAIPELPSNVKKVIVYYVDIDNLEEIQKFIEDDEDVNIEIELRDLKDVLDDAVFEDYAEFKVAKVQGSLIPEYRVEITNFQSDRVSRKIDEYNQKGYANTLRACGETDSEDDGYNEANENIKPRKKKFMPILISETGLELIEYISLDCTSRDGVWHSDSEIKIDKLGYVTVNGNKTKDFWDGTIKCEKKPLRLKIRNICGDETLWTI